MKKSILCFIPHPSALIPLKWSEAKRYGTFS
jgi:hypothetical protein